MTFSAPRVPPVLETQKVMVNEVEETPVACVDTSYTDGVAPPIINEPPGGDNGPVVVTIGTVTVTGDATPVVGDTETFTATNDGTANDVVFTFSAPGETFTGGTVTWANTGATTVTVTATSATATDNPVTGTLNVTVGAALSIALSSPDFNEGQLMPDCAGISFTNPCGGPALCWWCQLLTGLQVVRRITVQLSVPIVSAALTMMQVVTSTGVLMASLMQSSTSLRD